MVGTFEHAVRLHQLLPEFTVCHGGNGVKVKRNKAWTDETAPVVVQAVHKSQGTVAWFAKTQTALGIDSYVRLTVVSEPWNIHKWGATIGQLPTADVQYISTNAGEFVCTVDDKGERKFFPVTRTEDFVSFPKMFSDYIQMDGSPCGAPQMVDRNIGGIDMAQYRMTTKKIAEIRKSFESGELKKLIATNIFSEGVNFVHLKYLIRADGEISKISNTQIPGRLSRLLPGKTCSYLFDFIDHFSPWAYQRSIVRFNDYKQAGWLTGSVPPRQNKEV